MKKVLFAAAILFLVPGVAGAKILLNAVYDCTPAGFSLARTVDGYVLAGTFDAPALGRTYSVTADPIMIDTGNIGRTTLRMTADGGLDEKPAGVGPNVVEINQQFAMGTTLPISHLKIAVEKDFTEGPTQIECRQVGGSQ